MSHPIDLDHLPIFDHHAHALLRQPPVSPESWLRFFSEASHPDLIRQHVPNTLFYRYAVKALAGFLGCQPTPEAILTERIRLGEPLWARRLVDDANIAAMLIDYGFRGSENYDHAEMKTLLPCRLDPILRLETLAQELVLQLDTLDQLLDAFSAQLEAARSQGYLALKSIIAYRTGLQIEEWSSLEVEAAFQAAKEQARGLGLVRLAHKPLNDTLVLRALQIANRQRLPFQFHTGYGDNDIDMRLVNPLHFRPLLHNEKYRDVPWVILHMGYPYVRESAYLSSVYLNVFVDLSLAIPFAVSEAALLLTQLFGLAPTSKLLYASDGFSVPELFWLGAKVGRQTLSQVLGELVESQILSQAEALAVAAQVLYRNACDLYGVALPDVNE